jgi:hypothetical protein
VRGHAWGLGPAWVGVLGGIEDVGRGGAGIRFGAKDWVGEYECGEQKD